MCMLLFCMYMYVCPIPNGVRPPVSSHMVIRWYNSPIQWCHFRGHLSALVGRYHSQVHLPIHAGRYHSSYTAYRRWP